MIEKRSVDGPRVDLDGAKKRCAQHGEYLAIAD
jgi:hypothetical protein